jgi:LPS export ABC transporter protein LptC
LIYRLLILFALVLAGVAVWLTLAPRQTGPTVTQPSHSSGPDQGYAATDASVVETGADGLPMYTLQARQVDQDPASDVITLTNVHMTFDDTSGGHWQARSDQATAMQDSDKIDLTGNVVVSGTFSGNDQPVRILTDILHVDTQTPIIRTRSAVTLRWAGLVVQARGLLVNVKAHTVKLEAGVHGQFVP